MISARCGAISESLAPGDTEGYLTHIIVYNYEVRPVASQSFRRGWMRLSAVIERKPPIQEPTAANST